MNNLSMIGNLGKDPELRYTGSGTAVVNISIAVQRQFKNKSTGEYESDWFNCTAFRNTAEMIANNFRKGSKIAFTGNLQNNNYTNNDGVKIYRDVIIIQNVTFIESKSQSGNQDKVSKAADRFKQYEDDPFEKNDDSIQIDESDLPF